MKNGEKDTKEPSDSQRPFYTEGIGHRISGLIEPHGMKKKLSEATGISLSQLDRYAREISAPTIEPLARLADAAGVRLEWLATGKGPKHQTDVVFYEKFDVPLLADAIDLLETFLKGLKRQATPRNKAELVVAVYELLKEDQEIDGQEARKNAMGKLLKLVG